VFERFRFQSQIHAGFVSTIDQSVGVANELNSRFTAPAVAPLGDCEFGSARHLRFEKERAVMRCCDCTFIRARKIEIAAYLKCSVYDEEHVSEVDPVSAIYPLSFHRRIKRQWAERIKSLGRIGSRVVFAAKLTMQFVINHDGSLIPVPVRIVVDRRRSDRFSD
jgi:hypothetical protein